MSVNPDQQRPTSPHQGPSNGAMNAQHKLSLNANDATLNIGETEYSEVTLVLKTKNVIEHFGFCGWDFFFVLEVINGLVFGNEEICGVYEELGDGNVI